MMMLVICCSEGSVRVDFNLEHTYYLDRSYPSPEVLRNILVSELRRGKLGIFAASMENFVFERITSGNRRCKHGALVAFYPRYA